MSAEAPPPSSLPGPKQRILEPASKAGDVGRMPGVLLPSAHKGGPASFAVFFADRKTSGEGGSSTNKVFGNSVVIAATTTKKSSGSGVGILANKLSLQPLGKFPFSDSAVSLIVATSVPSSSSSSKSNSGNSGGGRQ